MTNQNSINFLIGFVIGGLAGSALTLLLAPQSGEETRNQIYDQGLELKDKADEQIENVKDRAAQVQEQGLTLVEEQTNKVKEVAGNAKARIGEAA